MKSGDSPLSKTGEKPSSLPKLKTRVLIISTFLVGLLVLAFLLPRQRKKKTVQNLDSEIAAAQRDLKTNPQDLKALALLGTCYFKKGPDFYPQGVNALEEARSLGSLDPDIFYYLGIMYQNLGFYPFALKEYQRYLRNFPDDQDLRQREAKLLFQAGRYYEAQAEYERLSSLSPRDPVIKENLGLCLWKNHEDEGAAEIFRGLAGASLSFPGVQRAEFYLGRIDWDKKDYKGALNHFLKAVPSKNEEIGILPQKIYFFVAETWQKLGNYKESEKLWKKVLALNPKDSQAKMGLRKARRFLLAQKRRKKQKRHYVQKPSKG